MRMSCRAGSPATSGRLTSPWTVPVGCALLVSFALAPASAAPPSPGPNPPAAAPGLAPPGPAAVVLDAFARAWAAIGSYGATVTLFEREGERTQDAVFDYTFRKPATATAHEAKGSNAGVTLDWNGGNVVVAHRSGLFSFFKKTIALHDPLATTIRGSSIDELSFGSILQHAEQVAGTLSVAPGELLDGVQTEAVTLVPSNPAADGGLTREVLELSTVTQLPARVLGYAGTQLVRRVDFSDVEVKPPA